MVSLVVSFTLTPMLCSRFLKLTPGHDASATKQTLIFRMVDVPYQVMLRWSMRHLAGDRHHFAGDLSFDGAAVPVLGCRFSAGRMTSLSLR
jgi:multidrug efflux pump subunit AcrB